ncbi:MAG: T9SS type A sorting domain-containing protein [Bacteroidetes bacterium]|nr:T9SS type A sorting domain-containing protein [Bacteroidota bacterium]
MTIEQTQSDTSVEFFQMPVPVEFSGLNEDTIIVFDHLYPGQTFSFNLNFEIKNIFFDPERWILSAENSVISTRQKNASEYPVLLFPNPAQDHVSVYFSEQGFPVLSARIIDATGRIVKKVNFDFPSSNVDFEISSLAVGFYIIEVETFDRLTNLHFVKSR